VTVTLLGGDALALPLADGCVDLIVTSPPYFGLRSYTDGGVHYPGQIGSEATPGEFIGALITATAEMVRVLKPSGSIWVNLGDKYSSGGRGTYATDTSARKGAVPPLRPRDEMRPKSLMGLPWRYAIRCIDELELILRAEVIWSKPNGLPESVTDRVRRSHEQWFHFTTHPRYYAAVDEIREPYRPSTFSRNRYAHNAHTPSDYTDVSRGVLRDSRDAGHDANPLGKLPSSVWSVPTQPLTVPPALGVDHFAAFPMEWPRRIIKGWSPSGICTACGEGRRPVGSSTVLGKEREYRITGQQCACPTPTAPTRLAVVLDPFGGTGTVAMVASALGRHGISVDMSGDYSRLARWRTTDPGERAKAACVDRPPPVPEGMDSLW
jgi:DNA modification methylase